MPPASPSGARIKAQWLRTYADVLAGDERYSRIASLIPADTAALLANPPLPGTWLDIRHANDIVVAIEQIGGLSAVRDVGRKLTSQSRKPYMIAVEALIRLCGTSPATLLKRMNRLIESFLQGVVFEYHATSDRGGVLDVAYADPVPMGAFFIQLAGLQDILDLCGVKGVVSYPERTAPHSARFKIQW
jgi:hypothetical protein